MSAPEFDLLLKGQRVVRPHGNVVFDADIAVQNGRVTKVAPGIDATRAKTVFDGRGRLVAQFLTESLVLATVGAVLGLVMALPAMRLLEAVVPESMGAVRLTLDWRVLGFAAAVTMAAALAFGLMPALRGTSLAPQQGPCQGIRGELRRQQFHREVAGPAFRGERGPGPIDSRPLPLTGQSGQAPLAQDRQTLSNRHVLPAVCRRRRVASGGCLANGHGNCRRSAAWG